MKCNYCSRELSNNAKFCTFCGSMLQKSPEPGDPSAFVLPAVPVETEPAKPESTRLPQPVEVVYPREALSFRVVNYGSRRHAPAPDRR